MPQTKPQPTDAELTALGAKIMGWFLYTPSADECDANYAEYPNGNWVNKKTNVGVIDAKDYSPPTKIEHALECVTEAREKEIIGNCSIHTASGNLFWVEIKSIDNSFLYDSDPTDLPDCARKIMETLMEVEGD